MKYNFSKLKTWAQEDQQLAWKVPDQILAEIKHCIKVQYSYRRPFTSTLNIIYRYFKFDTS